MMAEFQEVMKQWRRFCKSHSNCGECVFDGTGICSETHLSSVPYSDIELSIMTWAAEHPEPVYPTWYDYLHSIGVLYEKHTAGGDVAEIHWGNMMTPIPADMAEKLGLKPKE